MHREHRDIGEQHHGGHADADADRGPNRQAELIGQAGFGGDTRVMPAMIAPAALLRIADCRPASLPPQWKKHPQAMKAAQIASIPPSGPRKSQVAIAPSTPTLIARAVFEDISPPFVEERADAPNVPAVHRLNERKLALLPGEFGFRLNNSRKLCHFEHQFIVLPN